MPACASERHFARFKPPRRDDSLRRSERKRRFAEALARESSISRDAIDFALFGDRRCRLFTGANRNGLLLDTVDQLVFGADDDTLARTATARRTQERVSFSSEYEPREFWFFPDRHAALEAVAPTDEEPLCLPRAVPGQSPRCGWRAGRSGWTKSRSRCPVSWATQVWVSPLPPGAERRVSRSGSSCPGRPTPPHYEAGRSLRTVRQPTIRRHRLLHDDVLRIRQSSAPATVFSGGTQL